MFLASRLASRSSAKDEKGSVLTIGTVTPPEEICCDATRTDSLLPRDFVDVPVADVGDVKFAPGILTERRRVVQREGADASGE
jgi:hypothetical protein